jgi:hypothetical protein
MIEETTLASHTISVYSHHEKQCPNLPPAEPRKMSKPHASPATGAASLALLVLCLTSPLAHGCLREAYVAGPKQIVSFETPAQVFTEPLHVQMNALGRTELVLPLPKRTDKWSFNTEPLLFVLHSTDREVRNGKQVVVYGLAYDLLHSREAKALADGDAYEISSSHWKGTSELVIPITLSYAPKGRAARTKIGELHIERGPSVLLSPPLRAIEFKTAETKGYVNDGRQFIMKPGDAPGKTWRVQSASYQTRTGDWVAISIEDQTQRPEVNGFVGTGQGQQMKIIFELIPPAEGEKRLAPETRTLWLTVTPTPSC